MDLNAIQRREYEITGEKAAAQDIFDRVCSGEQLSLTLKMWNKPVFIVGAFKSNVPSVSTGTCIYFEWESHGRKHESHAINFDVFNPIVEDNRGAYI